MTEEYEVTLWMDDRCQLREMRKFLGELDSEGINTDYEEQVTACFDGEIIVHEADKEQMLRILKMMFQWIHDVPIYSVTTNTGREWYPTKDELRTVIYGTTGVWDTENTTDEKIWQRFYDSMKVNE